MIKMRSLVVVFAAFAAAAGCKNKEADQGGAKDQPASADKAADKMAGSDKTGGSDKVAGAAGSGPIRSPADYEARQTELTTKISGILNSDGKDCDKLGTDLGKFFTDNKAAFEAVDAFEKANPDARKAFDAKTKAQQDDIGGKLSAAGDACKDNAAFKDAMGKVPSSG
jgi:hypothetical protein